MFCLSSSQARRSRGSTLKLPNPFTHSSSYYYHYCSYYYFLKTTIILIFVQNSTIYSSTVLVFLLFSPERALDIAPAAFRSAAIPAKAYYPGPSLSRAADRRPGPSLSRAADKGPSPSIVKARPIIIQGGADKWTRKTAERRANTYNLVIYYRKTEISISTLDCSVLGFMRSTLGNPSPTHSLAWRRRAHWQGGRGAGCIAEAVSPLRRFLWAKHAMAKHAVSLCGRAT